MDEGTCPEFFLCAYIPHFRVIFTLSSACFGIAIIMAFFAQSVDDQPKKCRKLGLSGRGNLSDQYDEKYKRPPRDGLSFKVKALFVYPIKSCYPLELQQADVERMGMTYDRKFAFAQLVSSVPKKSDSGEYEVNHTWTMITQRNVPFLTKVKTAIWVPDPASPSYDPQDECVKNGGYLEVSFPFIPSVDFSWRGILSLCTIFKAMVSNFSLSAETTLSFQVPFNPTLERVQAKGYSIEPISIWKDAPEALNMNCEIPPEHLAKLKYFLGISNPLTLFRVDPAKPCRELFRNAPRVEEIGYQPVVGFVDAYPLHLLNLSSIQDISSKLPKKTPFNALRFRANIYISGPPAYAEDDWKLIRLGRSTYHVSARTARCKLPNNDMETGVLDVNEPLTTLRKYRQIDEGANPHPCLGMQMVPMSPEHTVLNVGDEVKVMETGEHFYIKQGTADMAA